MKQPIQRKIFTNSAKLILFYSDFITQSFKCQSLECLHLSDKLSQLKSLEKGSDQATLVHKAIYQEFDKGLKSNLILCYRDLCSEWVKELVPEYGINYWAIQRYPSVRIHFPNNISVFEFHRDSEYRHPLGEINHFLALTKSFNTAALQVEENLGWNDFKPLDLEPGESAILNTSIFRHGDMLNEEGFTRISIDFRAIPLSVLETYSPAVSLTKSKVFSTSDYFIRSDELHRN
jgi:hypothetical protein